MGKAGRVVDGRPACPSCANALRREVACTACGRPTKRPSRSTAHGGPICEPCARKDTHATCRTCRRHRLIERRDEDGRPLCRACGADVPVAHTCPGCARAAPGSGAARCPTCELADRVSRAVEAGAGTLRQDWARDLFTAFCGWDDFRRERGDMPNYIAVYARFFAAIDAACGGAAEVTQARLVELHGAEGLRRGFQAVAFLAERLTLEWDPDGVAEASERRRVADVIKAARVEAWAADLQAYRDHLAAGPAIAPATVRMYVSAATALLRSSSVAAAAELTRRHVAKHLRRSAGTSDKPAPLPVVGGRPVRTGVPARLRPKDAAAQARGGNAEPSGVPAGTARDGPEHARAPRHSGRRDCRHARAGAPEGRDGRRGDRAG